MLVQSTKCLSKTLYRYIAPKNSHLRTASDCNLLSANKNNFSPVVAATSSTPANRYTAAAALRTVTMARPDYSTQSNSQDVVVRHSHFELDINFNSQVIEGYAHLAVEAVADAASKLVLDTRDLTLHRVTHQPSGQPLSYSLSEPHKALGSALHINLPEGLPAGSKVELGIRFSCSPNSTALQFLQPSQTAGGKQPYLFTQCQAIHARSLVPCQDTPAVKSSYSAAVRVPAALTALMSAVPSDGPPHLPTGGTAPEGVPHLADVAAGHGSKVFYFLQGVPIPSYLIALAVGELASRELSDRSRVWSEPSVVDAAAYEFADTSKFLEAGEALAGPYVWGRYDLLLLPPSFPYGGMENPCLTFVTPTLLAGDRSLTNVVAHEIAHSWTGNLVTNASWEHFWLNEGWTVFLERKIVGKLQGEEALQFYAAQGAASLADEVSRIGAEHNFTRLVPDLSAGEDPDDAFSRVPYEKGFYFLYYLQHTVGGPDAFEPFMKAYLQEFSFKTVDSEQFKQFFLGHFKDNQAVASVDWETWMHAPGMPPVSNSYDTSLATAAYDLAVKWHTADVMGIGASAPAGVGQQDIQGWSSAQVVAFLDKLGELRCMTPLAACMARELNSTYQLDAAKNCEIRCAWYKLAIEAGDEAVYPGVVDMLSRQGRMKYLRPLYRALFRSKTGKALALQTFAEVGDKYHPIAKKMVEADLQLRQ